MAGQSSGWIPKLLDLIKTIISDKNKLFRFLVLFVCFAIFAHTSGLINIKWFKFREPELTQTEVKNMLDSVNKAHEKSLKALMDSVAYSNSYSIVKDIEVKQAQVEPILNWMKDTFGINLVEVYLFHNGEVSLNRLHKLKATKFFASDGGNHFREDIPLYPYVHNSMQIIKEGFMYVEDTKAPSATACSNYLISKMAESEQVRTIALVAIYNKEYNCPIGCVSFENRWDVKPYSKKMIEEMRKVVRDNLEPLLQ